MSSNLIKGTAERDGSITINGSTGSKEFEINVQFDQQETWTSVATATLNISADSESAAKEWISQNAEDIACACSDHLDYERSEWGPEDVYFDNASNMECNGEVVRQNLKVRVDRGTEEC